MVQAVPMAVSVDQSHRPGETDCFVTEGVDEGIQAVDLAGRPVSGAEHLEGGVGLHDHHHPDGSGAGGQVERIVQPGPVGAVASGELGCVGAMVVAPHHMHAHEHHTAHLPAGVLRVVRALVLERHGALPEAVRSGEHDLSQMVQAFDPDVAPPVAAIGPLVVTDDVDRRCVQLVEAVDSLVVHAVFAGSAALEVTVENGEVQVGRVHRLDGAGDPGGVDRGVGDVAPEADGKGPNADGRRRGRLGAPTVSSGDRQPEGDGDQGDDGHTDQHPGTHGRSLAPLWPERCPGRVPLRSNAWPTEPIRW